MGFGVWGLGFGVWGLGFGVWGLGFGVGVWGLGFGVGGRFGRRRPTYLLHVQMEDSVDNMRRAEVESSKFRTYGS